MLDHLHVSVKHLAGCGRGPEGGGARCAGTHPTAGYLRNRRMGRRSQPSTTPAHLSQAVCRVCPRASPPLQLKVRVGIGNAEVLRHEFGHRLIAGFQVLPKRFLDLGRR